MKKAFYLLITSLLLIGCQKDQLKNSGEWLINKDEVLDGGPGKDGIPSIDKPDFISASAATYLSDQDLVLGVVEGNIVKAYPHPILDWHEIINDQLNSKKLAITYCPLTGTGVGWNRVINGVETTFGVSGLLYNSNLIPYDRNTESNWSQFGLECVNGDLIGSDVQVIQLVETTWKTWKEAYPNSQVVSTNTGFNRSYGSYPYGDFRTNHNKFIFPVNNSNSALPSKERVLGIIQNGFTKAYRFSTFSDSTMLIQDEVSEQNIIVVGNQKNNFIVSFIVDDESLEFKPIQNQLPLIFTDQKGNKYDLFGHIQEGPDLGNSLTATKSFIGYWFGWAAFYPDIKIY